MVSGNVRHMVSLEMDCPTFYSARSTPCKFCLVPDINLGVFMVYEYVRHMVSQEKHYPTLMGQKGLQYKKYTMYTTSSL